jgi:C_GCAxxG_C_C family probable redox protein
MVKKPMSKQESVDAALTFFDKGYACSQSVLLTFASQFDLDEKTAKLIASTFGGGMGRLREKCGAVTGGFMVLGLKYGNTDPKDIETKLTAYKKVRELNHLVKEIHGTSNCSELLKKFASEADIAERRHHRIICRKVVGDVTELLYELISI